MAGPMGSVTSGDGPCAVQTMRPLLASSFISVGGFTLVTSSWTRSTILAFVSNSLALPAGLQFVDDLDTATGGWTQ